MGNVMGINAGRSVFAEEEFLPDLPACDGLLRGDDDGSGHGGLIHGCNDNDRDVTFFDQAGFFPGPFLQGEFRGVITHLVFKADAGLF